MTLARVWPESQRAWLCLTPWVISSTIVIILSCADLISPSSISSLPQVSSVMGTRSLPSGTTCVGSPCAVAADPYGLDAFLCGGCPHAIGCPCEGGSQAPELTPWGPAAPTQGHPTAVSVEGHATDRACEEGSAGN